jgi:hypothetical protein
MVLYLFIVCSIITGVESFPEMATKEVHVVAPVYSQILVLASVMVGKVSAGRSM